MNAKEMFEALGYTECIINNSLIEYTNFREAKKVVFYKNIKQVLHYEEVLTMPLLKAINQQCKELGWF
jgi:hypothetical protein